VLAIRTDGGVGRIDPDTGDVVQAAPAGTFPGATYELEVSPDGSTLLGPNLDPESTEVQLLDATSGERFGTAAIRDERFGTFDLSPDGTQFATLHDDGMTLVDGTTGARLATLRLPELTPRARVTYLPDSSGVLVAGVNGRTWTLDTRPDSWSARACTTAGRNLTRAEWKEYFPSRAYEPTCPQWPAGS
jgi:hypothetical protein